MKQTVTIGYLISSIYFIGGDYMSQKLDTLIPQYAENKNMLDDYKKICDKENKQIKELMTDDTYEAGGYKATKSVQTRESLNEDRLLAIASQHRVFRDIGIIKTKEYVDMEALESAIYKGMLDKEALMEIDKCRESKEVVTLRISKIKEK